ncbi:MAG: tetratricopeptide repeat protein [Flavipsychrobacter sp.]|jgi:tetratricopeptide (TPR) repeat protein|nr:tetratricopeptide repeat protein [Flavipsychrobacter sp.]
MLSEKLKYSSILAILSVILYANTLQNDYVMDDGQVIVNNKLVAKGISAIPELLVTPRLKGYGPVENDTYRPIPMIIFAVEHQFWGNNPLIGHLFNILFFACCVVVLFLFLRKLFKKNILAFTAALLFAIHPIHAEVVANIKSRDELLCFFFAFCALNTFINYQERGKVTSLVSGTLLFLLSLLSKETVITFAVLIPLICFFYANEQKRRSTYITVASLSAIILFFIARTSVLNSEHATDVVFMSNPLVAAPDLATRIATALYGLGKYILLLLIPYPLICDYSYNTIPFTGFGNVYVLLSLAVYIALAAFCIRNLAKKQKDPLTFGILFFLATIALFSNIPFLVYSQFAERFLFFPSVGFCVVAAVSINKWLIKPENKDDYSSLLKPVVLCVMLPAVLVFGYLTFSRNAEWKDNLTLYTTDIHKAPDNGWLCYNAGNSLITTALNKEADPIVKKRIVDDAAMYLSRAVSLLPGHANAHAQLSYAYTQKNIPDSARIHAIAALDIDSLNVPAITSLGTAFFAAQQYGKALFCFRKAIEIMPGYVEQYANIGACYLYLNQFDSSIKYLHLAIAHMPANTRVYGNLAFAYNFAGQQDSALKYQEITRQYYPRFKLPDAGKLSHDTLKN